jgi:hypothetical protein
MALETGNPYNESGIVNLSKRELNARIQGMFRNWYTLGNKNDYMSAFPSLAGVKPNQVNDVTPINFTDSQSGVTSYSSSLMADHDSAIVILTGAIVSADQDYSFSFEDGNSNVLYPPMYGSARTKTELSGENVIVPNKKGNNLVIQATLEASGSISVAVQGAEVLLNDSSNVDLNTGVSP